MADASRLWRGVRARLRGNVDHSGRVLLSRWYPHRMGMANGIAISCMGVGQLLVISVLAVQLTSLGWRGSFLTMAHHVAGGIGAHAGASIFDAYGSYTRAFVAMRVLSIVALGLTLVLPRRTLR